MTIEAIGVLKDISEYGFTWRECCEERDNDIMSETSLGQDCFLSAAECRQTVVHQVDLISGCGLQ